MKKYYHATPKTNLLYIMKAGIEVGHDGVVYLTEQRDEAARFLCLRGVDFIVFEVELDETKVYETFDHSEQFFRCKAFGYPEKILPSQITDDIWGYHV